MDYGGRPDISTILKRWGTEHEWGGGGEGQWFHTIAAAKFILRAKTLEIASAQTRRYGFWIGQKYQLVLYSTTWLEGITRP